MLRVLEPGEAGVGAEQQRVDAAGQDGVGLPGADLVLGQPDRVAAGRAGRGHQDAGAAHAQPVGDHVLGVVHGLVVAGRVRGGLALAEDHPEPGGLDAGQPRLGDRLAGGDQGERGGAVQGGVGPGQLPGDPLVRDLPGVAGLEDLEGRVLEGGEAALAGGEPVPELFGVPADGTDDSQAGDDDGPQRHSGSPYLAEPIR